MSNDRLYIVKLYLIITSDMLNVMLVTNNNFLSEVLSNPDSF